MTNATTPALYSPEAIQTMVEASTAFIHADLDTGLALHRFMRAVGGEPSYAQWECARGAYIQAYKVKAPNSNEDAQNKSWSRFVSKLRDYVNEQGFEFSIPAKPKADTKAATAMAEKRATEKAQFEGKSKADLEAIKAEAAQRISKGDTSQDAIKALSSVSTALDKVVKAEAKAAEKASTDANKQRRNTVVEYVKACPPAVLHLFELMVDATADNVAPDVQALAVKHLMAAMKPAKPAAKK